MPLGEGREGDFIISKVVTNKSLQQVPVVKPLCSVRMSGVQINLAQG